MRLSAIAYSHIPLVCSKITTFIMAQRRYYTADNWHCVFTVVNHDFANCPEGDFGGFASIVWEGSNSSIDIPYVDDLNSLGKEDVYDIILLVLNAPCLDLDPGPRPRLPQRGLVDLINLAAFFVWYDASNLIGPSCPIDNKPSDDLPF